MKISRPASARRRRSPLSLLLILVAILIVGLLVAAWVKGGAQPQRQVEIPIPAEQLGR